MSTWSTCTWGFHSDIFTSVMIVASEHSPCLVACVRRERNKSQKYFTGCTAGLFARNLTSFTLCHYAIGLFNRLQTNLKHKRKRMWFDCEQPFLWGERCVTFQKTVANNTICLPVFNFLEKGSAPMLNIFFKTFQLIYSLWWWNRELTLKCKFKC